MANKRKLTGKERRKKKLQKVKKLQTTNNSLRMSSDELVLYNQGVKAQMSGDLAKAEEFYKKLLSNNPDHPQALLQIGTINYTRNNLELAEEYMSKAFKNGLQDESFYINYGLVCDKLRRDKEAEECYDKAIELEPKAPQTYFNKGLLLYRNFRFEESVTCFTKANELDPGSWMTEFQLGCSLQECKRYDESLKFFTEADKKQPENARILCGLAMSLLRKYKYHEALSYVERAVKIAPNNSTILFNYAFVLKENGDKLKAKSAFERAIELDPNSIEALLGLGRLLTELGDYENCRELFQKAIDIKPDYYAPYASMGISYYKSNARESVKWFDKALEINPKADDVYSLRGYALNILGDTEAAEMSLRKAIELSETHAEYHQNLGNVLVVQSKIGEALEHCKRSIELNPRNNLAFSNVLLYMHYIPQSTRDDIWKLHQTYSNLFEPKDLELHPYLSEPRTDRKIRIGLVSSDFRKHSVAYFVEPLLTHKDSANFEYYTYANVKVPDKFSQRIADFSTKWQSILQLSDVEAAELIRQDKIDILVDLGGHTADNRLKVFCLKPAPVQVSWLGYPDTTGLKSIDYRLVDDITEPEGAEKYSSEKIIRLPGGFHCYSPFDDSPDVSPSPSKKNGYVTYGSFNNFAKCSPETIFLWSEILKNVPNSRIVLKALSLGDKYVQEFAYKSFESFGISRDRVSMYPRTKSLNDHFKNYNDIDIALDTYPYNGTTTSCEAMWMGVPMVTFYGPNHASRVGLSLLTHMGIQELAGASPEEYVNKAVALGLSEEVRDELRSTIRERLKNSPIIDATHFAKKFENAMTAMWKTYCENPKGRHEPTPDAPVQTPSMKLNFGQSTLQTPSLNEGIKLSFGAPKTDDKDDDPTSPPEEGFKLKF